MSMSTIQAFLFVVLLVAIPIRPIVAARQMIYTKATLADLRGREQDSIQEIHVDSGLEAARGVYTKTSIMQNGVEVWTGPNGAVLHYEKKGSTDGLTNWGATNWLNADGWYIIQDNHHRYGFVTDQKDIEALIRSTAQMKEDRMANKEGWQIRSCDDWNCYSRFGPVWREEAVEISKRVVIAIELQSSPWNCVGTYQRTGKLQNGVDIWTRFFHSGHKECVVGSGLMGDVTGNHYELRYEVRNSDDGSNWGATEWLRADGWFLVVDGHHYAGIESKRRNIDDLAEDLRRRGVTHWLGRVNPLCGLFPCPFMTAKGPDNEKIKMPVQIGWLERSWPGWSFMQG